jgi:hypothetical protein
VEIRAEFRPIIFTEKDLLKAVKLYFMGGYL